MSTPFLYNPSRKSKANFIEEFVVRTNFYEEIMHDLETSEMKFPEQHYLLVGQRGAGKTTLLTRIKYGIEDNPKLKNWLIPVLFDEEQYNVSELANLWENVGQYLEDYHGFDDLYNDMEQHLSKANFEELCLDILEKSLATRGKKLVLLIDNIGDFFNKIDKLEVRRFREILQTKSFLRVIAGSPFYLDTVLDYQQPFFEFFKMLNLNGLNKQETETLLLKLGEVYNEFDKIQRILKETPQRIEAMRNLTGGVPRTMALLFNIFVDNEHSNSVNDLEKILDAVTPLYKHRMDDLPKQQQKIVDAVARNWDPISVKDLKDKVRLESKVISAQLRQLEKNQVIEKKTTDTKNHEYQLRERFWNIWFLMRYGRKDDKQRVIWLVRFLESWCDNAEITQRIENFIAKAKDKSFTEDELNLFTNVYTSLNNLTLQQKMMLKEPDVEYISGKVKMTDDELFEAAMEMSEKRDFTKMLNYLVQLKKPNTIQKILFIKVVLDCNKTEKKLIGKYFQEKIEMNATSNFLSYYHFSLIYILCQVDHLVYSINTKKEESNFDIEEFFLLFLSLKIRITQNFSESDFSIENLLVNHWFRFLMKNNLIHFAKKIVNKVYKIDDLSLHFKDVFKPLYYAVEYFDTPEKIQNLPSEIANVTFEIRNSFLKQ